MEKKEPGEVEPVHEEVPERAVNPDPWVVERIKELLAQEGLKWTDLALLHSAYEYEKTVKD